MLKSSIIFTNVMIGRIYMHPPFSVEKLSEPALFLCCIRIPSLGDASENEVVVNWSPVAMKKKAYFDPCTTLIG